MENTKINSKIIGYWMSEKKRQKLNWSEFRTVCKKYGYDLIKLDLTRPLEDQGPFSLILHKLTDIIALANRSDPKAIRMITEIERYIDQHPEVAVIDPLEKVRQLLDRYETYSVIRNSSDLSQIDVFTPSFVEITSNDVEENILTLKKAGVRFPFVCKPSVAQGSIEAHKISIIFNERGVQDCKPPAVAQSFVNHNAVLYKIYCIGEKYVVVERPSLKNFYSNDQETIFFSSPDVSKSDSTSSLSILDDDDPYKGAKINPPDPKRLEQIVKTVRKEIGMLLLGIDVVVQNNSNRYAIIDINAYPGYDGFPNFFDCLMSCIIETIEKHEVKPKESTNEPVRIGNMNHDSNIYQLSQTSQPNNKYSNAIVICDQDQDSGFDTSDSSDEKKKH